MTAAMTSSKNTMSATLSASPNAKRYRRIDRAWPLFTTENGIEPTDVRRILCLDLNLGDDYDDLVLRRLESFFREAGTVYGSFLLRRCIEKSKLDDDSGLPPEERLDYDDRVRVSYGDESSVISETDRKRLSIVANNLYREQPDEEREINLGAAFRVTIERFEPDTHSLLTDERFVSHYVCTGCSCVLMSARSHRYLKTQAKFLERMRTNRIPKYADCEYLFEHRNDSKIENYKRDWTRFGLLDLVFNGIYEYYCDFVELSSNHRTIPPTHPARFLYENWLTHESLRQINEQGIFFDVRYPIESFTGRESEVARLHDALRVGGRVVISGLGGTGKSQLALRYVERYRYWYRNVIWIDAETYKSMKASFVSLARDSRVKIDRVEERNTKEIVDHVYRFFSSFHRRKSLFILDDAKCYRAKNGIWHFVPRDPDPLCGESFISILVTSRHPSWPSNYSVLGVDSRRDEYETIGEQDSSASG